MGSKNDLEFTIDNIFEIDPSQPKWVMIKISLH